MSSPRTQDTTGRAGVNPQLARALDAQSLCFEALTELLYLREQTADRAMLRRIIRAAGYIRQLSRAVEGWRLHVAPSGVVSTGGRG